MRLPGILRCAVAGVCAGVWASSTMSVQVWSQDSILSTGIAAGLAVFFALVAVTWPRETP